MSKKTYLVVSFASVTGPLLWVPAVGRGAGGTALALYSVTFVPSRY